MAFVACLKEMIGTICSRTGFSVSRLNIAPYVKKNLIMFCNFRWQDIDVDFSQFVAHNESKNIFKAARTPAVIVALIILFYIFSGIFGLFGLYLFATIANTIMGVAFIALATWAYIR